MVAEHKCALRITNAAHGRVIDAVLGGSGVLVCGWGSAHGVVLARHDFMVLPLRVLCRALVHVQSVVRPCGALAVTRAAAQAC